MSLSIVQTSDESLVNACVIQALRDSLEQGDGSAVLLVPTFARALDAQRILAQHVGLSLAVRTTTPSAWVKERWEVWGDGRTIADAPARCILAREVLIHATEEQRGPIELSLGVVSLLSELVDGSLPWLPLDERGRVQESVCASVGLTTAETKLVGLVGALGRLLAERGYISSADASVQVPALLGAAHAKVPPVVVAGFGSMNRRERELVRALGALTTVTFVAQVCDGPASEEVRELLAWFAVPVRPSVAPTVPVQRNEGLQALMDALFGQSVLSSDSAPVEFLLPSGPVAEAELLAAHVSELMARQKDGRAEDPQVVIAVTDVARARRELVPKLVARGVSVRLQKTTSLDSSDAAVVFFSFAETVAHLSELAESWPEPIAGLEGPVAQLGDMSWWPPSELIDFLLSDMAHMRAENVWRLDAIWRGNRLLTPARVLEMLQSERDVSAPVARATTELLRGRVGTAASKLLAPYAAKLNQGPLGEAEDEARAVLQAVLTFAGTLRELGLGVGANAPSPVTLSELVELCEWASVGGSLVLRQDVLAAPDAPHVRLMDVGSAATLAPGSVDVLVLCGLTTSEQPISAGDDLLSALLELLGVEPKANPMAHARARFHALVAAPRQRLVLERALHDADAQTTYPSVMLSELLASYGVPPAAEPADIPFAVGLWPETQLGRNLSPTGEAPACVAHDRPAPAGRLTQHARELVFVPQAGSDRLPDGKPVLSASQIETYLDCPYKWFSLRRLRLGQVDAGHTGMEMGTFAHRVLEVTHRELLARALEAEAPGSSRDELLAAIEANPARPVPGSALDANNLEDARQALELEFDLHQQHMYMVKRPRQIQQLLIAHDSFDRAQEDQLRQDLLSSLEYQTRVLTGFEPRLFEWSFGRRGNLVEYAGAYFTGTVDRIDVSPHGTAVIIDYKHKSPVGFAAEYDALQEGVLEGTALPNRVQSLIYAQVVRRAFEGSLRLVGTVYLSTKSPHALAGAADENVADLVFGPLRPARASAVCVPATSDGEPGMNELLDRTEELVAEQVKQMLAGNVEARPRDRRSCDFCPVMQCEQRMAR